MAKAMTTSKQIEELIGRLVSIERCPWNPFPIGSEWGDEIDRKYSERRARLAILSKEEA